MTKALHRQKNSKSNVTTQNRHQKLRLHNDCGYVRLLLNAVSATRLYNGECEPTYDGQLGNDSHPIGVVKPVYGIPTFPLTAKAV